MAKLSVDQTLSRAKSHAKGENLMKHKEIVSQRMKPF